MKTFTKLILLFFLSNYSSAQNKTLEKSKYTCTIILINTNNSVKGEIYSVTDSTIVIRHKKSEKHTTGISCLLDTIPFIKIDKIKIKKNSAFMEKVIMYSLISATTCVLGVSGQDVACNFPCTLLPPKSDSTLITNAIQSLADSTENISIFGEGIFSALIGVISNGNEKSIQINGRLENYMQRRSEIMSYSILK